MLIAGNGQRLRAIQIVFAGRASVAIAKYGEGYRSRQLDTRRSFIIRGRNLVFNCVGKQGGCNGTGNCQ